MKLEELRELGGIVSAEPVEREVTWTRTVDGEEVSHTFTVFVLRMPFGDIERMVMAANMDDRSQSAEYLSKAIMLGDGTERLTYEDAYRFDPSLAGALIGVVRDVNGTGEAHPKKSRPPRKSGTN